MVKAFKPKNFGKSGPEAIIEKEITLMMRNVGWFVKKTHGNAFTAGWPDLICCSKRYGQRWVEVKLPNFKGSKFTKAQLTTFPRFCAHGSGVWGMTNATEEEYKKLFAPANWYLYCSIMRK